MAEVADAYVSLIPSVDKFKKSVESELGVAGDRGGTSAGKKASSSLGKWLKRGVATAGLAAGAALSAAVVKGWGRLTKIENATATLKGLGNSAKDVEVIMDNALASVKGTAFGLDAAAMTAAGAVAAGIKPGKELEGVLKATANAAAATGMDMNEMGAVFNKVASLGKANNQALQQVANAGLPIYQALADQMGITADAVFKMASKGEIDFATFSKAMETAAGTVADELGKTTTGSIANFFAAVSRFGAAVIGPVFERTGTFFQTLTGWVDDATDQVGPLITAVSEGLGGALETVTAMWKKADLAGRAKTAWAAVSKTGESAFEKLMKFLDPILDALMDVWADLQPVFQDVWDAVKDLLPDLLKAAKLLSPFGLILEAIKPILPDLVKMWGELAGTLGGVLAKVLRSVGPLFTKLASTLGKLFPVIAKLIEKALPPFIDLIADLAEIIGDTLIDTLDSLMPIIDVVFDLLADIIPIVAEIISTAMKPLSTIIGVVARVLSSVLAVALALISPLLEALTPIIVSVADILLTLVEAILPPLAGLFEALEPLITMLTEVWGTLISGALKPLLAVLGALMPFMELWGEIVGFVIGTVVDVLSALITFIKDVFSGDFTKAFTDLQKAFEKIWNQVKDFLSGLWTKIRTAGKEAWEKITSAFKAPAIAINKWFSETFVPGLTGIFTGLWTWVKETFSALWVRVKSVFTKPIGDAYRWVKGKFTDFVDLVKGLPKKFADGAKGMWNFVTSGLKGALNAAIGLINSAIGTINSKLIDSANFIPGVNIPHIPKIPTLATGGVVSVPTLAIVGDAGPGNPEIVAPQKMLRDIIRAESAAGSGVTQNIYPAPGMNEIDLANSTADAVRFALA